MEDCEKNGKLWKMRKNMETCGKKQNMMEKNGKIWKNDGLNL